MKCVLLCAGYATRLYPLTLNTPKPLLEVGNKPIIENIIRKLEEINELKEVIIVTNNKFFWHFRKWLEKFKSKKKIKILNDKTSSNDDRLGAIGDINFAVNKEKIKNSLLIIAGDNLFELSLADLVDMFNKKKEPVIAIYDVKDKDIAKKYGIVAIDKNKKIIHFEEKPENPRSTLASTGIYLYAKENLKDIKRYLKEGNNADKPGSFLEWLYKRKDIYCLISKKRWYDIGSFEQLDEARKNYR